MTIQINFRISIVISPIPCSWALCYAHENCPTEFFGVSERVQIDPPPPKAIKGSPSSGVLKIS